MTHRTILTGAEEAFVRTERVARLATADEDGNPHAVPVCYAYDGTRFYIALDEKPKRVEVTKLRRVRNIIARPRVALLFDQYNDDWSRLGYVLVQGRAELLYPEQASHAQALSLLRERYIPYRAMTLEQYPVIVVTPESVASWGQAISDQRDQSLADR